MKINKYSIEAKPIQGVCKMHSMWGYRSDKNSIVPLIYFKKPKWISQKSFDEIVRSLKLNMPVDFEVL